MRKVRSILVVLLSVLLIGTTAFAQDTTDYTFGESEVIDFCVYNTWGQKNVDCTAATIQNMRLVVEISDYSGDPVTMKLYNRESTTWGWWTSEPQTISGDGTYTFDIDLGANAYDSETLCTIYLKDVACAAADEDPTDGGAAEASGISCHIKMVSCDFNTTLDAPEDTTDAVAEDTAADTAVTTGVDESSTTAQSSTSSIAVYCVIGAVILVAIIVIFVVLNKKKKAK